MQLARRQFHEAVRTLKSAVALAPTDTELASLLSNTYANMGDFDSASSMLKQAAKLMSAEAETGPAAAMPSEAGDAGVSGGAGNTREAVRVALLRGAVFLERGEYDAAIETAGAVQTQLPGSPLPSYLMGIAYEGLDELDQAVASYERALQIDPSFAAAVTRLGGLNESAGEFEAAKTRYQTALIDNPHHPEFLRALARLARETGDEFTWLRLLKESRAHNPTDIRSRVELASHLLATRPDDALAVATEALELEPASQSTTLLVAQAEIASGEPEKALRRLLALEKGYPDSADVQSSLAYAYELMRETEHATTHYTKALERDDGHFDARLGLGRMALLRRQADRALQTALRAQQIHPERAEPYVLQGDAYRLDKQPAAAVRAYRAALDRSRDAGIVVSLSSAYWDMGDRGNAERQLRDWLAKHPEDNRIRKELAQIGLLTADVALAISQYERIVETSPTDYEALNNLAYLLHRDGNPRALELARQATELAPGNLDILDTYGWILSDSGQLDKGLSVLRKIVDASPDQPDYRLHLAEALLKAGRNAEARETLIPVMKGGTDSPHRQKARQLLRLDR